LIWTLHHTIYDAWSFRLLLGYVAEAYRSNSYTPSTHLPFSKVISYHSQIDKDVAKAFWIEYLSGASSTSLFKYSSIQDPRQDSKAIYYVLLAAWALLASRLTTSRDITLGYLLTGRTAAVEGIETAVGPTIDKIPLRIQSPQTTSTLIDAVEVVHAQLIRTRAFWTHRPRKYQVFQRRRLFRVQIPH
jgi:hypothetical protein